MMAEKDRSLNGLRSEQEKLQGRLMSANADRSALLARCAQLEQQINDQHKSMDTLQKQISNKLSSDRRREGRHNAQLLAMRQNVDEKEHESVYTVRSISQALGSVVEDGHRCQQYALTLSTLLHRLGISPSGDDSSFCPPEVDGLGDTQIGDQITQVRQSIKCSTTMIGQLSECGVAKVDFMMECERADREEQLRQSSAQLTEAEGIRQAECQSLLRRLEDSEARGQEDEDLTAMSDALFDHAYALPTVVPCSPCEMFCPRKSSRVRKNAFHLDSDFEYYFVPPARKSFKKKKEPEAKAALSQQKKEPEAKAALSQQKKEPKAKAALSQQRKDPDDGGGDNEGYFSDGGSRRAVGTKKKPTGLKRRCDSIQEDNRKSARVKAKGDHSVRTGRSSMEWASDCDADDDDDDGVGENGNAVGKAKALAVDAKDAQTVSVSRVKSRKRNKPSLDPLNVALIKEPSDDSSDDDIPLRAIVRIYKCCLDQWQCASRMPHAERLIYRDISLGRERYPIECVNAVDESVPSGYRHVNHWVAPQDIDVKIITSLQLSWIGASCRCNDGCSSLLCPCARSSETCWFDMNGRLSEEFNFQDPPLILDCNLACRCRVNCNNRVAQNGISVRIQVFRTEGRGWGLRALMNIPKGTFICEYIGELISDCEAEKRENDTYLFDLDNMDDDTYCLDAHIYGNVARFINHHCEPNMIPFKVFVEHHDLRFPRICFFSCREISAYEEFGFDYGYSFWIIKYKQFTCSCRSLKCKYSADTIKRTLEEYRIRREMDDARG